MSKNPLTRALDDRRFREADITWMRYVGPIGARGLHKVRPDGSGKPRLASGPHRTFKPGNLVPVGSHTGTRGLTILQGNAPPGKRGSIPPVATRITKGPHVPNDPLEVLGSVQLEVWYDLYEQGFIVSEGENVVTLSDFSGNTNNKTGGKYPLRVGQGAGPFGGMHGTWDFPDVTILSRRQMHAFGQSGFPDTWTAAVVVKPSSAVKTSAGYIPILGGSVTGNIYLGPDNNLYAVQGGFTAQTTTAKYFPDVWNAFTFTLSDRGASFSTFIFSGNDGIEESVLATGVFPSTWSPSVVLRNPSTDVGFGTSVIALGEVRMLVGTEPDQHANGEQRQNLYKWMNVVHLGGLQK